MAEIGYSSMFTFCVVYLNLKILCGKNQYVLVARYLGRNNALGNISIDSIDTPILYSVSHIDVMRVACFNWSSRLTSKRKDAWNARATELNNRDVLGKLVLVLVELSGGDGPILYLLQSLTLEWENTGRVLKSCITCAPRNIQSMAVYSFRKERVEMDSQVYKAFIISFVM